MYMLRLCVYDEELGKIKIIIFKNMKMGSRQEEMKVKPSRKNGERMRLEKMVVENRKKNSLKVVGCIINY